MYEDHSYTNVQDLEYTNSVKTITCKKQTMVKVSTRFLSTELLINAKIYLASFIYDCINTFCTPYDKTNKISNQNKIIKIIPYLLMTDIDSALVMFIIIADKNCNVGERAMRKIMLKILLENDIYERLDTSNEHFEQFNKRNPHVRKQVGLYEFENIEHGIICANNVNPKEYHKGYGVLFEINKKHKGMRKGTKDMDFDKYASRILTLEDTREGTNRFALKSKQTRFQNKRGNMSIVTIEMCEYGQLNDKRYILPDSI